tara:strand:- start:542 stop:1078 length:537 start_codon:yes stop_codon:yes gene_type:complete
MNYKNLNELASEAIRYMNPENDWRFVHADSYTFYMLTSSLNYSSSFPMWEKKRDAIFKDIKQLTGKKDGVITNFTLVNCNKYSVVHPTSATSGIITLKANGAYAVMRPNSDDNSRFSAYRALYQHAPHLMHWQNSNSHGFKVGEQKHLYTGERIMNYYPKEGTLFFHFTIDEGEKWNQ